MADPILVKLLAEAALQAAKDRESRNRLLAIILGPVIFLLLLVALTMYLATSPFSALSEWLVGDEAAAVDEFQKDYGYNNDSGIFERDFREADGQEYDEDILLGREGETQVVYYNQLDERWADEPYGQDKIGTHGCGPTSMSIVVSTLTGTNVDPVEMAQWSYENGYYCPGGGSYHSLIPKAAEHWGLSVDMNLDGENVADALDRIPVVGSVMIDKIKRTKNSIKQLFIPGMLFENMGITYLGPVDGHNIQALCKVLREAQKLDHAVLVHVMTKKGKGYRPAERNPSYFHGVGPFDVETGKSLSAQKNPSYTDVFSRKLCQLGEEHPDLVAVTAAMPDGTGLAAFGKKFPDRFFDVGIAEAHGVTSAAGMAAAGLRPVVAVYSSFLQRAYDQVLHDVCIQNLPVLFAVDRAGLVGSDGETHQGIFDYSFLTSIPNMSVMAPKNLWELRAMLDFAMDYNSPLAIRYPRGEAYRGLKEFRQPVSYGAGEMLYEEGDIALLAVGSMVSTGEHVREKLKAEGYRCSLANGRFVKPFDRKMVSRLAERHRLIVTMEENVLQGGYGLAVTAFIHENYPDVKVLNIAIPDAYVEHGNVSILREGLGIDSDSIIRTMKASGYIGPAAQESPEVCPVPDKNQA